MQERHLGRTGLKVSRLGLGTGNWGGGVDEHEARDLLKTFVDAGGTLIDTAAGYSAGLSEELIGSLIGDVVAREEIVIATKAGVSPARRSIDVSRGGLIRSLDASLRRLGVDYIDLWQLHTWSDEVPIEETLSALDYAVSSGRVAYVGVSNYAGWQLAQSATWQHAVPGRAPVASIQSEYSLLKRSIESEIVPAASAFGVGLLPWSPLGRGVLTGKYRSGIPGDSRAASDRTAGFVGAYLNPRSAAIVEAVARAADGLGWSALEVALAWVRDAPGVTAPIIGARTAAQLQASLAVEDRELPSEIRTALDDVSAPGV